uniref:D-isomer specific 2-hydroxyacid dehydrogenase NAD-binding domain-containing protein n=1 Tax=Pyramimonas obovata TaxID=1411642 RepID=A0A7S0N2R1_9CHLO|mmetsp:Transcript_19307/g.42241  ORF Transcript_19307/g.42241 Transcript_19307/m.42241 type:complete len:636 (+) Transcript_19307:130-2037(+)|eukprot:CAMPEP_0118953360 /NCGR_PEP_ID=MMETSP1169-20130426/56417_1 /TAXON_ID=36882 /ORGANISM="Pyramimonas obovata, Strain CCMP722" /LENGTH=635 /DNA_ID=CAMNT_0006900795 /DNA_START=61 /DNA_END=1968 /DNA_ORIENTATION=-
MKDNKTRSTKDLPLVLAVNCLQECTIERSKLDGVARVEYITGHSKSHQSLIKQASVIIVLSLNDLGSSAQSLVSSAELVVCIGSGNPQLEAAIAEELRIQRLVHVNVQLVDEAADTTLALILALLRRTHVLANCCLRGIWAPNPTLLRGARRCNGLTLGLLGLDNVALAVAQRAIGFGFQMTFYDPLKERDREEAAEWAAAADLAGLIPARSVEELVTTCDVVSIHCSPCEETMGILDRKAISLFKPGAILVNTSSGELVDEDALRHALLKGSMGGAALDAVDSPAWFEAWVRDISNLIMTPRCACYSDQAFAEQRSRSATVVHRFLTEGLIHTAGQDAQPSPRGGGSTSAAKGIAASPKASPMPALRPPGAEAGAPGTRGEDLAAPAKDRPAPSSAEGEGPGGEEAAAPATPEVSGGAPSIPNREDSEAAPMAALAASKKSMDLEGASDTSSEAYHPLEFHARAAQRHQLGAVVAQPEQLLEGMVVALVAAEPLPMLQGEDAAPSGAAKTEGVEENAQGHYYGLRMDAVRKVCRLAAMPGLSKADPAVQLIVIRRKNTVGFRAGLAEGKVLQLTKAREMLFTNHNFGSWESWHMVMDGDVFVLSNKKWKDFKWKVKMEVVGEVVGGVVRLKGQA